MPNKQNYWMQSAFGHKHGAMHRQLGYAPGDTIPPGLIRDLAHATIGTKLRGHSVTTLLKRRAMAAYNARRR